MHTNLAKYKITYPNSEEYHLIKNEIFTNDCYHFQTDNPTPIIIDVGAYIGLSILYFKREYPNCKILAFEPNLEVFEILKENLFINGIKDVQLHPTGIWTEKGTKKLHIDNTGLDRYSVGSFTPKAWNGQVDSTEVEVDVEKLDQYLTSKIDLLKLDIEGSEQKVLKSIKKYFHNIKNIIVEFHPTKNQNIDKLLSILKPNYYISIYYEGKDVTKNYPKDKLLTIKAIYKN